MRRSHDQGRKKKPEPEDFERESSSNNYEDDFESMQQSHMSLPAKVKPDNTGSGSYSMNFEDSSMNFKSADRTRAAAIKHHRKQGSGFKEPISELEEDS